MKALRRWVNSEIFWRTFAIGYAKSNNAKSISRIARSYWVGGVNW